MRISDWSSDVCSSDLKLRDRKATGHRFRHRRSHPLLRVPAILPVRGKCLASSDLSLTLPKLQSVMPFQRPDPSNGSGHVLFEDHERPPDATKNRPDRMIEPVPFMLFGGVLFADAHLLDLARICGRLALGKGVDMLHAFDHFAPHSILAVKECRIIKTDEELAVRAVRIGDRKSVV